MENVVFSISCKVRNLDDDFVWIYTIVYGPVYSTEREIFLGRGRACQRIMGGSLVDILVLFFQQVKGNVGGGGWWVCFLVF